MQIGTEDKPIQSKITITIHGSRKDPSLPQYGNKVIALRDGILDIHGKPVSKTFSKLYHTVNSGQNQITLRYKQAEDIRTILI